MADYSKLTHFFGEMDLDLSKTANEIYEEAFRISECCGYFLTRSYGVDLFNPKKKDETIKKLTLYGNEGEVFTLWFKNEKFVHVTYKSNGETMVVKIPSGEGTGYGGYFSRW